MSNPAGNRLSLVIVAALVLFATHNNAPAQHHPLDGLERLKNFETRRASSCQPDWQTANGDMKPIEPGGTLTVAELEGPGVITHIWFTINAMYRKEHPCVMGRNYLFADIVGRGHYVGTIQSVCHTGNGWYGETEPHKPWPALPAGLDRLPFRETVLAVGWKAMPQARRSEHPLAAQPQNAATDGKHLWFKPADDNGWLEVPFRVEKELTCDLTVRLLRSWDYGTYRVLLDGKEVGKLDLYAASAKFGEDALGRHTLAAGDHVLRFECVGRNAASKGHFLGFDNLQARIPAYVRPVGKDLSDLQAKQQN